MTSTNRLRYAGFILVIAASLLLLLFCSLSLRNRQKASADDYAVLVVTQDSDVFPTADFDLLFSNLNLPSAYCALDASKNAETESEEIARAVKAAGSKHVILLAYGDAAMPVLNASLGQEDTAAVILLAPTLKQTDSIEAFGTSSPSVRTAIFSFSSAYSTSLYERLSGEDTTLFPGVSDGGSISSSAFISPDAARYIESWNLTGSDSPDRTVLPLMPDVQIKVGEYINNYILPDGLRSEADLNRSAAVYQVLKGIAYACLLSGLMLFFATIPQSPRRERTAGAGITSPFVREKNDAGAAALRRTAEGSLVISGVFGVFVSAAVIVLYVTGYSAASAVLFCWPPVFYAIDAFFHFRSLTKSALLSKVPAKRFVLSGSLMLFFLLGNGAVRYMYTAGLSRRSSWVSGVFAAGAALFLFLFVWISNTAENQTKAGSDSRLEAVLLWRKWILFLPFIAMIVFRLASRDLFKAAASAAIAALLLWCLWIRGIFHRIMGTEWGGAIAFSILYTTAMII